MAAGDLSFTFLNVVNVFILLAWCSLIRIELSVVSRETQALLLNGNLVKVSQKVL